LSFLWEKRGKGDLRSATKPELLAVRLEMKGAVEGEKRLE
jgi:hypothetical protein